MRRRIVSRIVSGQDVCLFCAFRPALEAATRSSRTRHGVRDYASTAVKSSPVGTAAAAAPKDDQGEDEPPMLRKNAELINSFPSRKQTLQPPSQTSRSMPPSRESTFPPQSRSDAQQTRSPQRFDGQRGPSISRNGEVNFQGQFRRSRNLQNDNSGERRTRQDFKNRRSDSQSSNSARPPEEKEQPQSNRFGGPSRQPEQPQFTSGVRRFVPYADSSDEPVGIASGFRRPTDIRSQGSKQDVLSTLRPRQDQRNDIRRQESPTNSRLARGPANENFRPQFANTPRDTPRVANRTRKEDVHATGPDLVSEGGIENIEAPAGLSFGNEEVALGFHRRRGQHDDKRRTRSSRFEEEENTEPGLTSNTTKRFQSASRGFDFDMAEAEEALYGSESGRRKKKSKPQKREQALEPTRPTVRITEFMSVSQLAKVLNVQLESFIRKLEEEGFEGARYDHILDAQTSVMLADIYGFDPVVTEDDSAMDLVARPVPDDISSLPPRPPIVTIMGHVDHGKTTILDYLRKSSVVATEHGGITQHIGAFSVTMPGSHRQITFLDTPGHAAFLEMRRRGANVTDIVVLVVAADDSVKPQTVEAIKHAMEAKVQVIVAINKVDKEDADIERVKQDLTRHEIVVEDYGGDFQAIPVSGKTGQGMAELEEAIITLADVNDYRAEQDGPAEGTIIESKVTVAGRVATVLIRRGTLRVGDFIVAGPTWARVRTLRNDMGILVDEAPPGTPVQVDGWRGEDPTAGLEVLQAEDEKQAKDVIKYRAERREGMRTSADLAAINEARSEEADARARVLAWEAEQEWARKGYGLRPKDNAGWVEPSAAGGPKRVHFVVKADVAGSVEAVVAAVTAVGNNEIVANVIHSGTGQVTESDIHMLATTGETGYAISFNQPIEGTIARLAESAGLQILDHNIIYKVTDVVKEKLGEQLPSVITQKVLGEAEVGQIFEISTKKDKIKIAGCRITNGTISRANKIRVLRGGEVIYTGTLHSLKNVKKDVTEMRKGTECGMGFEDWEDFREGDQVQCFQELEEKRAMY